MSYVDGFIVAVPTENREAYLQYAKMAAEIFKDHGALTVAECWGDSVPDGVHTSFPMAVKCKDNETVVFSWITWPSKEIRDASWGKLMSDPRFDAKTNPMPFDGKRMIYGGFEPLFIV